MTLHNCCLSSEFACVDSGRFSISYADNSVKPQPMHTQNTLEIYYSISSAKSFIIDDMIFPIHERDVFIINQFQVHRVEAIEGQPHDRYILSIMPEYLKNLSSSTTDLTECFYDKSKFSSHVSLTKSQHKEMMGYFDILTNVTGFGADLIEDYMLTKIILLIVNASKPTALDIPETKITYIPNILNYIEQHLEEDLSLANIAANFHISKGYLCRVFKKHTGMTLHEYISTKRIAKAKQLLATGHSIQETITMTGFNDYANFIRRFKDKVDMSPKRYAKQYAIKTD